MRDLRERSGQKTGRERRVSSMQALKWVRLTKPLACPKPARAVRVADLFCGCGGMTLGASEGARRARCTLDVRLAVDLDAEAIAVYASNFMAAPGSVLRRDMSALFDGGLNARLTRSEAALRERCGPCDLLLAGPPCQGHSDLNNATRRDDPRNLLYLRAARAVEVLTPRAVILENVPSVVHDRASVVETTRLALERMGYYLSEAVVDLRHLGLPQRRRRHILLAVASRACEISSILPKVKHADIAVRPFVEGLEDEPSLSPSMFTQPSRLTPANRARVKYLFTHGLFDLPDSQRPPCHRDKPHSYRSVYGRIDASRSAQTITSGFGSMGQGRYVHPERPRLITPHEAARIQGFPDFFDFSAAEHITALRTMIGNAVPPPLAACLTYGLLTRKLI